MTSCRNEHKGCGFIYHEISSAFAVLLVPSLEEILIINKSLGEMNFNACFWKEDSHKIPFTTIVNDHREMNIHKGRLDPRDCFKIPWTIGTIQTIKWKLAYISLLFFQGTSAFTAKAFQYG